MENIPTVQKHVDNLEAQITNLSSLLEPLLLEDVDLMTPIQQADHYAVLSYALNSIIFAYLKSIGADPKTHPISVELSRIKTYMQQISNAKNISTPSHTQRVDSEKAARFIKHALSNAGNAGSDSAPNKDPESFIKKPFINCNSKLAEGPTYDHRCDRLYWIDIDQQTVYWSNNVSNYLENTKEEPPYSYVKVTSQGRTWDPVSALFLTKTVDRLIVGTKYGLAVLDLSPYTCTLQNTQFTEAPLEYLVQIHNSNDSTKILRFNDGAVDPSGHRIFIGSMADVGNPIKPIGSLYMFDTNNFASTESSHKIVVPNTLIPNGIGWSLDKSFMYFVESAQQTIYRFDYNTDTGAIQNKTPIVLIEKQPLNPAIESNEVSPEPDGLTISADGSVWVALWEGGKLCRYLPSNNGQAQLIEQVLFPKVRRITCPTFGGPNNEWMFVTTASLKLKQDGYTDENQQTQQDTNEGQGGKIFAFRVKDTVGIPKNILDF